MSIGGVIENPHLVLYGPSGQVILDLTQMHPTLTAYGMMADVRDFGAVGDGVTDSTSAIQTALDDCAGLKPVWIPAASGHYIISGQITVPANTHLIIDGYLFLKAGTNQSMFLLAQNGSNFVIEGAGTLDGNSASNGTFGSNGTGGIVTTYYSAGGNSVIRIRGLTITSWSSWPVNISGGCSDVQVVNCTFTDNSNAAEFVGVTDGIFSRCHAYSNVDSDGIALNGGCVACGIYDCICHDNGTANGILIQNGTNAYVPDAELANHDIVVSGCICYNNGSGGITAISGLASKVNHYNIQIIGCDCYANNQSNAAGPNGGISLNDAENVVVSGCASHHNGNGSAECAGITMLDNSLNISVVGCRIYDNGQGGTAGDGIYIGSAVTDVLVQGTKIFDDQATPTQQYGLTGGGGARIYVFDCPIRGNITAGINLATGSGVTDNRFQRNPGYNPYGYLTPPVNPPVSGTTYQNPFPFWVEVNQPAYATTALTAGKVSVSVAETSGGLENNTTDYVSGSTSSTSPVTIRNRVPPNGYIVYYLTGVTLGTPVWYGD